MMVSGQNIYDIFKSKKEQNNGDQTQNFFNCCTLLALDSTTNTLVYFNIDALLGTS